MTMFESQLTIRRLH